ncbi:hypothetical protein BBJ28_00014410 [Nothophytophthora sp. Chile5]|nr:hypothetical protein BBJ28_00014410 [Nothophytophthora sp. Chile5]
MSPPTRFAFFKLDALGTPGYAYGSYVLPEDPSAPVKVALLCNGRWGGHDAFETERARTEVAARAVSAAEASSGIGTFTGSCICAARIPPAAARLWDYGIVVGYEWFAERESGVLHVQFDTTTKSLTFDEGNFQEVAVETYAMRACFLRAVADIMPSEMTAINHAAYVHFNGIGKTASRSTRSILLKLNMNPVDEALSVPLFDVQSSRVVFIPIKYVLDFIFYLDGKRRAPRHVMLGASVFEGADAPSPLATPPPSSLPNGEVGDMLSDSEGDSDGEMERHVEPSAPPTGSSASVPVASTVLPPTASVPLTASRASRWRRLDEGLNTDFAHLHQLRASTQNQPTMVRDIDEFIALKKAELARPSGRGLVLAPTLSDAKAQFRPSSLQTTVHQAIVHGTFLAMCSQLLVETLQSQRELLSFLPHPAVLRGLYSWDFGMRGLSVMHFARLTTPERREIRAFLAQGDSATAATVKFDFSVSHVSYVQIMQSVTQQQIAELLRASEQPRGEQSRRGDVRRNQGRGQGRPGTRQQVSTVPTDILRALPSSNGKSLCMKYLAVNTCRGRGDDSVFDYRGLFRPTALAPPVHAFIEQHYGGLKPEFKDL